MSEVIPGDTRHNPRIRFAYEAAEAGLSYDYAMQLMLQSPTYKDKVIDSKELEEFHRVMRDGYRKILGN